MLTFHEQGQRGNPFAVEAAQSAMRQYVADMKLVGPLIAAIERLTWYHPNMRNPFVAKDQTHE
jgi:hypothetical protein